MTMTDVREVTKGETVTDEEGDVWVNTGSPKFHYVRQRDGAILSELHDQGIWPPSGQLSFWKLW